MVPMKQNLYPCSFSEAECWPGQGTEVHILHTKADLAFRFSKHPSVPIWHTLPSTLTFSSLGAGMPFPYRTSVSVSVCLSFSPLSPLWPTSSSPHILPFLFPRTREQLHDKPAFIFLIWLDLAHRTRGEKTYHRVQQDYIISTQNSSLIISSS